MVAGFRCPVEERAVLVGNVAWRTRLSCAATTGARTVELLLVLRRLVHLSGVHDSLVAKPALNLLVIRSSELQVPGTEEELIPKGVSRRGTLTEVGVERSIVIL